MSEEHKEGPTPPHSPHTENVDMRNLRSAQTLMIAASIMGPVSMFFGGVILSGAGLVCGILSFRKIAALIKKGGSIGMLATRLRIACIVAIVVTLIALVLNIAAIILVYPLVVEALQTGDYSKLFPNGSVPPELKGGGEGSTWG